MIELGFRTGLNLSIWDSNSLIPLTNIWTTSMFPSGGWAILTFWQWAHRIKIALGWVEDEDRHPWFQMHFLRDRLVRGHGRLTVNK